MLYVTLTCNWYGIGHFKKVLVLEVVIFSRIVILLEYESRTDYDSSYGLSMFDAAHTSFNTRKSITIVQIGQTVQKGQISYKIW